MNVENFVELTNDELLCTEGGSWWTDFRDGIIHTVAACTGMKVLEAILVPLGL